MENKFFFVFQALIICNGYIFTNALIGRNIQNARRAEYPAVVALAELDSNYTLEENVFCSGVFITKTHILSSQHCFEHIGNRNFRIIAENPKLFQGIQYFPLWWTTHDMWASYLHAHPTFHRNDLAMLKIKGQASSYMIPSLISTITNHNVLFGRQVQIVGFGKTNTSPHAEVLQTANVNVLSNEVCENYLKQFTVGLVSIHARYICTMANPHVLLAAGDSGGPLYYQGTVVALHKSTMSSVLPIDDPRRVNIHLSLDWYRQFINEHLNK